MNIDKLKKVIQEANPEIMELKHGCKVIYADEMSEPSEVLLGMYEMNFENTKVLNPYNQDDSGNLIEILGRPIRLADVLLAINKNHDNWHDEDYGLISLELEENSESVEFKTNEMGYAKWNLKKDFDNQSDELQRLLTKLLVK